MHIDVKVTTWNRIHVDEEQFNEVIEMLKNGQLVTDADICNHLETGVENLIDVEEFMLPSENGGCATIEAFDDNNEVKYSNGEQ